MNVSTKRKLKRIVTLFAVATFSFNTMFSPMAGATTADLTGNYSSEERVPAANGETVYQGTETPNSTNTGGQIETSGSDNGGGGGGQVETTTEESSSNNNLAMIMAMGLGNQPVLGAKNATQMHYVMGSKSTRIGGGAGTCPAKQVTQTDVASVCYPVGGEYSKNPTVNETARYACYARMTGTNGVKPSGTGSITYVEVTPTSTSKETGTSYLPIKVAGTYTGTPAKANQPPPQCKVTSSVMVQISVKAYDGKSNMTDAQDIGKGGTGGVLCLEPPCETTLVNTCPSGSTYSEEYNACVQTEVYCSDGTEWNEQYKACLTPGTGLCNSGYYWDTVSGKCVQTNSGGSSSCGDGTKWDEQLAKCVYTPTNKVCPDGSTSCTYCDDDDYALGTCKDRCNQGYYWNGETCVESGDRCNQGYYWNGETCVEGGNGGGGGQPDCPAGSEWYSEYNACVQISSSQPCPEGSYPNESGTVCIGEGGTVIKTETVPVGGDSSKCNDGYYYYDGVCLLGGSKCDDGYYYNGETCVVGGGSGGTETEVIYADDGSGRDYRDYLDSLFGNNDNGYYSGYDDWANSKGGGDGSENLDGYFNNIDDDWGEDIPGDVTNDLLGEYGTSEVAGEDGYYTIDNGEVSYIDDGTEDGYSEGDYVEGDIYDDGNGGYGVYGDGYGGGYGSDYGDDYEALLGDVLNGAVKDADGTNPLLGGLIGANDGSLSSKFQSLLNGDDKDGKVGDSSNQELFDFAKKILLANGVSLDDLKKGKNYDAGSAYTDPSRAWDMNRITTLLKSRKIKLTSPSENKARTNNSSLTNASASSQNKNSTNGKNSNQNANQNKN